MKIKMAIKAIKAALDFIKRFVQNESSKKKSTTTVVISLIMILILVPAAALSAPGIILKGIISKVTSNEDDNIDVDVTIEELNSEFEITNSEVYKLIKDVYIDYNDSINDKINQEIDELKQNYTYTHSYTIKEIKRDKNGNIQKNSFGLPIFEDVECEDIIEPNIIKDIQLTKPEIQLVLAYISTKYENIQIESDSYIFDETEIEDFLNAVTELNENIVEAKVDENGNPKEIYYTVFTKILSPNEIVEIYFTEKDYEDEYIEKQGLYNISYESLSSLEDEEIYKSFNDIDLSTLTIYANGMSIPQYYQYDEKWANIEYGNGVVKDKACGPSCIAMVYSFLLDEVKTPIDIINWLKNSGTSYYVNGVGSSWSIFTNTAAHFGITCNNIGLSVQKMVDSLSNGKPVIASMRAGQFTSGNHFIVLRGITESGDILVNDPNDNEEKRHYEKEYSISAILNECKNMWEFTK